MAFEKELEFFVSHQDELVQQYLGQVLVLQDSRVVDAGSSPMDAYAKAVSKLEPGTFMLQPCQAGPSAYTVTISSVRTVESSSAQ